MTKPARFTDADVRFVRKHLRLRQADLAAVLNTANHSAVAQWESHEDESAGTEYNTEVLLRIWMAARAGEPEMALDLLEHRLKNLAPRATAPLEWRLPAAARGAR